MRRRKGTGSVYRRSGSPVWWIKYHRHGRAFRESTRTTDCRKAERMLSTRLAEINQGTFMGPQLERTKVDELAVMFVRDYRINDRKSLTDAETRWNRHLKPFFGGMRAVDVSSEQLARYVDKRQQAKAANATIALPIVPYEKSVPKPRDRIKRRQRILLGRLLGGCSKACAEWSERSKPLDRLLQHQADLF
jgi:hypothetical protein